MVEDETDGEASNKVQPQRTSTRVTRSNPGGGLDHDESTGDEEPPAPITPKAKPRPRPLRRQKTPSVAGAAEDVVREPSLNPESSRPSTVPEAEVEQVAIITTPQSSRKRPRSEDHDEVMLEVPNGMESATASPEGPEIEVRRKRVRH